RDPRGVAVGVADDPGERVVRDVGSLIALLVVARADGQRALAEAADREILRANRAAAPAVVAIDPRVDAHVRSDRSRVRHAGIAVIVRALRQARLARELALAGDALLAVGAHAAALSAVRAIDLRVDTRAPALRGSTRAARRALSLRADL